MYEGMPSGKCKQCGKVYYGWAFKYKPEGRVLFCCECGGDLESVKDNECDAKQDSSFVKDT